MRCYIRMAAKQAQGRNADSAGPDCCWHKAGSLWHSKELYAKAPGKKELVLIEEATHMDLYGGEGARKAMTKLSPFFKRELA
jgi:fermentation-respiration switch protein FrsA (DUF1100 family)